MRIVNIHAAKTHLSRLIEQACAGEEIVIARGNRPVVRLVPLDAAEPRKEFGSMEGVIGIGPEFFDPLPEEELEGWDR